MAQVYSLKELKEMKRQTLDICENIVKEKLSDGTRHTAAELAEATQGLMSVQSMANSLAHTSYYFQNNNKTNYNFPSLRTQSQKAKSYSIIYYRRCDEYGNPIGELCSKRICRIKRVYSL